MTMTEDLALEAAAVATAFLAKLGAAQRKYPEGHPRRPAQASVTKAAHVAAITLTGYTNVSGKTPDMAAREVYGATVKILADTVTDLQDPPNGARL